MGFRLPSYKPDDRNHCHYSSLAEPCYGQVRQTDEECTEDFSDCWDVIQCEAHTDCHSFLSKWTYQPSPYEGDKDATILEDDT